MLTIKQLSFALAISLGLAANVFANPMTLDLVYAASKDGIANNLDRNPSKFLQATFDASVMGFSPSVKHEDVSVELLKKKRGKVSKVPESSSLILLGLGLVGLGFLRRRKH